MTHLAHIPPPSDVSWISDWDSIDGGCDHHHWIRMFGVRSWTIETAGRCRTEVELGGYQFSDSSVDLGIWINGETDIMNADEALMLAATLSRAAEELERIEGCSL